MGVIPSSSRGKSKRTFFVFLVNSYFKSLYMCTKLSTNFELEYFLYYISYIYIWLFSLS